jgi:hypothetical protein
VIRAQKSIVIAYSMAMGATSLICAGTGLLMGNPVLSLICLGIGGLFVYAKLGGYLWVDANRVGVSRFPSGASCPRDELAHLRIVFVGRSRRACAFARKDGHTAFRVSANTYGTTQLKALARSLGVPYYDMFSGGPVDFPSAP